MSSPNNAAVALLSQAELAVRDLATALAALKQHIVRNDLAASGGNREASTDTSRSNFASAPLSPAPRQSATHRSPAGKTPATSQADVSTSSSPAKRSASGIKRRPPRPLGSDVLQATAHAPSAAAASIDSHPLSPNRGLPDAAMDSHTMRTTINSLGSGRGLSSSLPPPRPLPVTATSASSSSSSLTSTQRPPFATALMAVPRSPEMVARGLLPASAALSEEQYNNSTDPSDPRVAPPTALVSVPLEQLSPQMKAAVAGSEAASAHLERLDAAMREAMAVAERARRAAASTSSSSSSLSAALQTEKQKATPPVAASVSFARMASNFPSTHLFSQQQPQHTQPQAQVQQQHIQQQPWIPSASSSLLPSLAPSPTKPNSQPSASAPTIDLEASQRALTRALAALGRPLVSNASAGATSRPESRIDTGRSDDGNDDDVTNRSGNSSDDERDATKGRHAGQGNHQQTAQQGRQANDERELSTRALISDVELNDFFSAAPPTNAPTASAPASSSGPANAVEAPPVRFSPLTNNNHHRQQPTRGEEQEQEPYYRVEDEEDRHTTATASVPAPAMEADVVDIDNPARWLLGRRGSSSSSASSSAAPAPAPTGSFGSQKLAQEVEAALARLRNGSAPGTGTGSELNGSATTTSTFASASSARPPLPLRPASMPPQHNQLNATQATQASNAAPSFDLAAEARNSFLQSLALGQQSLEEASLTAAAEAVERLSRALSRV